MVDYAHIFKYLQLASTFLYLKILTNTLNKKSIGASWGITVKAFSKHKKHE